MKGPLHALGARVAMGQEPPRTTGYGPLVNKGDLWLPEEFNYQVISRQGKPMSDGQPTPGIFDGMGAYPDPGHSTTILIRNHENRERAGEQKVVTGPAFEYDETTFGGNTKLQVRRQKTGQDPTTGQELYTYEVVRDFAILGGTSTNCAGGIRESLPHTWITCEEVVKRSANGKKHGYIFEIDALSPGPVPAIPVPQSGRFVHEAALEHDEIIYLTEDRNLQPDPVLGTIGACFYRYVIESPDRNAPLHQTAGRLEALAIKGEPHAHMDTGRVVGKEYPVEWVPVPEPDHDDDTDDRRDRVPNFTPTRIQAQDNGAAYFDRQEGMWTMPGYGNPVFFDCTTGGAQNLGQVWAYVPGRETITLVYESTNSATLENPDNMVHVPQTGDVLLQEDSDGEQYIRGLTPDGQIYDFAKSETNDTEFCGGCFDPLHHTLYVNHQGERGGLPDGPPDGQAVTYAIYGPFGSREGGDGEALFS